MTVLGKILVIVNLVFSLITGALIVMVYVTRTNWYSAYNDLKTSYEVASANAETYRQEVQAARVETNAVKDQAQQDQKQLAGQVAAANEQVKTLQTQLAATQTDLKQASAAASASVEEIKFRRGETEQLQKTVADRDAKILALQDQTKKAQDNAVAANIVADSLKERNKNLLTLNEQYARELEQARAGGGGGGTSSAAGMASAMAPKPPPQDVTGRVVESDPQTGLVTIDIGSDSGVIKGNTLEVYRLQPRAEYVGMIRIVDARYHEAVARAIMPLRTGAGPIRKGDYVASRLTSQR